MSDVVRSLISEPGGVERLSPRILLGQFERVGSTFYLDQLEQTQHIVHNEPYKLLVPDSWPIARDYEGGLVSVDDFFNDPSVAETEKHWLRNFIVSFYHPGDQVIKETNLYMAAPQFLDLFPESDIELLTRNPLGIVSSFKRNDLYKRWGYGHVAEVVALQLQEGSPENAHSLLHMLERGEDWMQKLVWMIGLNAVLLSRFVAEDRVSRVVSYEGDIIPLAEGVEISEERTDDSIFSTNIRKTHDDFEHRFTSSELHGVQEAMDDCATFVATEFDNTDQRWFDTMFARHTHVTGVDSRSGLGEAFPMGQVTVATEAVPLQSLDGPDVSGHHHERRMLRLDEGTPVLWDSALVTNQDMAVFLQDLFANGHDPRNNRLLLLDNMPTTRGGRILFDQKEARFQLALGFEQHPAYWVSWLAAALYAYHVGMRLPYYAEWERTYNSLDVVEAAVANHSYAYDDVIPTGTGETNTPTDFFGNLKIWCADWSNSHAVSKKLAGISWKNRVTDTYKTEGERPYLTSSRIIGARLVRCSECPAHAPRRIEETAAQLGKVVALIDCTPVETGSDLSRLNLAISGMLTGKTCSHTQGFLDKESSVSNP